VQIWDAATGKNVHTYGDRSKGIGSVAWSPGSKHIVAGKGSYNLNPPQFVINDGAVQIWDTATGNTLVTYHGNSPVAWSPGGTRIVSGSDIGGLVVWDAADGKLAYTYRGISSWKQYGYVRAVAWSPDSRRIATATNSYDQSRNEVQVWDAVTGNTLFIYHDRGSAVNTVAWSPDGKHIASGGWGSPDQRNTVDVWQAG
jgi:WD40 repeat protein